MPERIPIAKCDFCMVPEPEHVRVVVSKPVLVGDILTAGEWAACSDCYVDLMSGGFEHIFQRWMKHAGGAAVSFALASGQTVVVADWRAELVKLWSDSWKARTSVREATEADRMEMVSGSAGDAVTGADPAEWPEDLKVREFPAPVSRTEG